MTKKLRVGQLNYLNALPLYTGLQQLNTQVTLVPGNPAQLNAALLAGDLDISLVSSYVYLQNAENWDLLPGFCIAAQRRVLSVNLYTRLPIQELHGKPLALTSESASSVALLKLLCSTFWQIEPQFETLSGLQAARGYPAFLLIGDQALAHQEFDGYTTLDLAEAWYDKTALPMTFALFAVPKSVMRQRGDEVTAFCQELDRSLSWAEQNRHQIVRLAALSSKLPEALLSEYFERIRCRLHEPEWNGLRAFATLLPSPVKLSHQVPA